MSYTSLYAVYKTKATRIKELKNSWGSGPAIWDYIHQKIYGTPFPMMESELGDFWGLWKDERLTTSEKVTLLSTYEKSYVEIERLGEFSEACKVVHKRIINNSKWSWNHFEDIGATAFDLYNNHDHRCIGFAIGCTSVCDPWEGSDREQWPIYASLAI